MTNLAIAMAVAIAVAETVAHEGSGRAVAGPIARTVAVGRTVVTVGCCWRRNVVTVGRCAVGSRWGWRTVAGGSIAVVLGDHNRYKLAKA